MKLNKIYIFLTAILLMLGCSIVLNFLIFDKAKKYYSELNQTRLDPLGISYYPVDLNKPTNPNQTRLVFFGDSRAASWISPNLGQHEFINRGISSQTTIQTLQRFPSHVSDLKPNIILIQVGVNDLKTVALFPEKRDSIVRDCQANIKRIVEESRKLGAIVIITTIFPVGKVPLQRQHVWSDDIGKAIKETNDYIATLANEKTIVFDTFSILADKQGAMLQQYSEDELHLNQQGYAVLNQQFVKLIDKIGQKN